MVGILQMQKLGDAGHGRKHEGGKVRGRNCSCPPFSKIADFGSKVDWGQLTQPIQKAIGLTPEMAKAWRDFYIRIFIKFPTNPTAPSRAVFMETILQLFADEAATAAGTAAATRISGMLLINDLQFSEEPK